MSCCVSLSMPFCCRVHSLSSLPPSLALPLPLIAHCLSPCVRVIVSSISCYSTCIFLSLDTSIIQFPTPTVEHMPGITISIHGIHFNPRNLGNKIRCVINSAQHQFHFWILLQFIAQAVYLLISELEEEHLQVFQAREGQQSEHLRRAAILAQFWNMQAQSLERRNFAPDDELSRRRWWTGDEHCCCCWGLLSLLLLENQEVVGFWWRGGSWKSEG